MTNSLHPYQRQAMGFLRNHDRAGLFMDMGLGKTATVLRALEQRHIPVLVVAPKRVAENVWHTEADEWRPGLRVARAVGNPRQRAAALQDLDAHVVVISRDNVADALPYMGRFNTLVLDELSSYKNRATQRWNTVKKLAADIPVCWGLTGTPAPNGLMDLWAQMFLLDAGAALYPTLTKFRTRFFYPEKTLPNGVVAKWALRPQAEEAIHEALKPTCISMSAETLLTDLPPMTVNHVAVPLPPKALSLYATMAKELVVEYRGKPITAANAAAMTGKLAQITAGFLYPQDEMGERIPDAVEHIHEAKMDALAEIVDGTGSPVLVFYRFKAELEMLRKRFPQLATMDEADIVDRWNAGEVPLLAAHPASAGHGLNLQKGPGHTIVWTTLTYSLEQWQQANRRLARQGQKAPVVVHLLEAPDSVDGMMYDIVTGKATVQGGVMAFLDALARS